MSKCHRIHVYIPENYTPIFAEYVKDHPQFSLSSFLVQGGVEKLTRARGKYLNMLKAIDEKPAVSEEEFHAMSREEKWRFVRGFRE